VLAAVVVDFDDALWPLDPEQLARATTTVSAAAADGMRRRRTRRFMGLSSPARI
jgi:hypothetical protein